jgi:hypothetical protein
MIPWFPCPVSLYFGAGQQLLRAVIGESRRTVEQLLARLALSGGWPLSTSKSLVPPNRSALGLCSPDPAGERRRDSRLFFSLLSVQVGANIPTISTATATQSAAGDCAKQIDSLRPQQKRE